MNFEHIVDQPTLDKTVKALEARNVNVIVVNTKAEALEIVKGLIPAQAPVMTGSSTTLQEIGFVDLLKSGNHSWNNIKEAIATETDPIKQTQLRNDSVSADYFLGSVHAVTEEGELLVASASGSQIPSYAFTSQNVIWVSGTQKIVPTLSDAFTRVKEYVFPKEDTRMKTTGASGTIFGMWWIFERNIMPHKLTMIFVKEVLGF